MLVLSRFIHEEIEIETSDGRITICLIDIRGHRLARIGIKAPEKCSVNRKEIADRIRKEKHDPERSPH